MKAVIERDVRDIAQIEHVGQMPRLLRVLAQHSAQLMNSSAVGASLGIGHVVSQKYITVLEQMFLVRTLQPWFTNDLKRLVETPKLHFLDSGLLAALRGLTASKLSQDRMAFGALLETFVLGEPLKLASWSHEPLEFLHLAASQGRGGLHRIRTKRRRKGSPACAETYLAREEPCPACEETRQLRLRLDLRGDALVAAIN